MTDTLKGPFNILEDDKLFDDCITSMYCKSCFLPKCKISTPQTYKHQHEEEEEYKTFFTRIFMLLLK